jgi:ABC-type branched-subunit amino acid transport system substrate-binding protein
MAGIVVLLAVAIIVLGRSRRPGPIRIAFANALTGVASSAGTESLIATQLYIDQINRAGGINGHPIELMIFNDASSPDTARANAAKIANSDCIAVLGHYLSATSLAAGPVYKDGRIPAITGTALFDQLTIDNPYYFRAQTTISAVGRSTADYIRQVWHDPVVELIAADDKFGTSYRDGFVQGYQGAPLNIHELHVAPQLRRQSGNAAVDAVAKDAFTGVVVIGSSSEYIGDILKGLRRRGITVPVIGTSAAGRDEFLKTLTSEPEEIIRPGYFSENFYAAVPLIFDNTGAAAQVFAEEYERSSGRRPGWPAVGADGAARLLVAALQHVQLDYTPAAKAVNREHIRLALDDINTPQQAVAGINGQLFFDSHHDMPRAIRMGYFHRGRFVTAPVQLVPVEDPEFVDLVGEREAGHIVTLRGLEYWLQRVVYTGIDINKLSRVDQRNGTFTTDFYLWMRYAGDDDAPVRVEFPRLQQASSFDPGKPLRSGHDEGLNYRLYRVVGDFEANYDLHQYPFDKQQLLIRFQNTQQRRELVVYVIDRFGLKLANAGQDDVQNGKAYGDVQLWRFLGERYFVDWFSLDSTLGQSTFYATPVRTEYAAFNTAMILQRNYRVFIFKTLLPLFLLVLVVFATMFFTPNLVKEQVTIPVTAILTSAVLLIAMGNQLPDIGYTVAIERAFYIFFALCLITMTSAFLQDRLRAAGKTQLAITLNHASKTFYLLTVAITILAYWFFFLRH